MQALKALVITLGILIFIGFGVLAYGFIVKFGDTAGESVAAGADFGEVDVALPAGARVLETRLGDGRMVVRIEKAGGGEALVLIDPATGRRLGIVHLVAGMRS